MHDDVGLKSNNKCNLTTKDNKIRIDNIRHKTRHQQTHIYANLSCNGERGGDGEAG